MTENKETYTVERNGKIIVLTYSDFASEVNIDDLIKIDYSNIVGELLTFPTAFLRIGHLKADADNAVQQLKLEMDVLEARLAELYRLQNTVGEPDTKGNIKYKKPSEKEIENAVLTDDVFITKKKQYYEKIKQQGYIDSVYWSAKDKSEKLNKLFDKLTPEEHMQDVIEGTINGVLIKTRKKLIE